MVTMTVYSYIIIMYILVALTLLCGWFSFPFRLHIYNTRWMPGWMRPPGEYLESNYFHYYPAAESRKVLSILLCATTALTVYVATGTTGHLMEYLLLLHALLPSCYLIHRYLCFGKINRFTPNRIKISIDGIGRYRLWKVLLVWLFFCFVLVAKYFFWLPTETLRQLTLVPAVIAFVLLLAQWTAEFFLVYDSCMSGSEQFCYFMELTPFNYYMLLLLSGVGLTQLSLWSGSVVSLLVWMTAWLLFIPLEYYFRFNDRYETDIYEMWGDDKGRTLFTVEEELNKLTKREVSMLSRKKRPCWLLIMNRKGCMDDYCIEISADLHNKQREMNLRGDRLLYIQKYPSVTEACEQTLTIRKQRKEETLINEKNAQRNNLNELSTNLLSSY